MQLSLRLFVCGLLSMLLLMSLCVKALVSQIMSCDDTSKLQGQGGNDVLSDKNLYNYIPRVSFYTQVTDSQSSENRPISVS